MYKNILLKLSGESLMSDKENINKENTLEIAKLIKKFMIWELILE